MVKISAKDFICSVRARAREIVPSPPQLDPLSLLLTAGSARTLEGRTIARVMRGIIHDDELDDVDLYGLSPPTIGWIASFTDRWAQGMYSDEQLQEFVNALGEGSDVAK